MGRQSWVSFPKTPHKHWLLLRAAEGTPDTWPPPRFLPSPALCPLVEGPGRPCAPQRPRLCLRETEAETAPRRASLHVLWWLNMDLLGVDMCSREGL